MVWIDQKIENVVREKFSNGIREAHHAYRTWLSNRFFHVTTVLKEKNEFYNVLYNQVWTN